MCLLIFKTRFIFIAQTSPEPMIPLLQLSKYWDLISLLAHIFFFNFIVDAAFVFRFRVLLCSPGYLRLTV